MSKIEAMGTRRGDLGRILAIVLTVCLSPVLTGAAETHGPDVGVTVQRAGDDPRPLIASGKTITLAVGVDNLRGDAEASDAKLVVTLESGLKLTEARPAPEHSNGRRLTWTMGHLPAGAFPRLIELDLGAEGSPKPGTKLDVEAAVATTDSDSNQANNDVHFPLYTAAANVDLEVTTTLDAVALIVGSPTVFHAEVRNLGTLVAPSSTLALVLPPKVALRSADPAPVSSNGRVVAWQLGDIAPGDARTVEISIALDPSLAAAAGEALAFEFDAATASPDANPADNRLKLERKVAASGPDLKVWLNVADPGEAGAASTGGDVDYAIRYGNFGNAPAPQALLSLSLDRGLRLVSAEPPATSESQSDRFAGGIRTWRLGDLVPGQSGVIRSRVHIDAEPADGSLAMALISSSVSDVNPSSNASFDIRDGSLGGALSAGGSRLGRTIVVLLAMLGLGVVAAWIGWRRRSAPR